MYVLEAKNKEMSLLVFHGLTLKKMIFYQFYQSIFMYILFGTLGIALGYKLTPVIFKNIYYKLHYVYDIKIINQSFYQAIYMLLMMLFISLVLNIGYVYRGLILISIIITTLICFNLNNLIEMYRMIIAYIIMIPMIVFCITYKNLIISKKNVKNQNCIYKLGITKKYQKKFIKEETLIMYGILFILPMTYMISTLGRFYVYDGISILIFAFIIGYFILNLLISMYISYKVTTQFFRGV